MRKAVRLTNPLQTVQTAQGGNYAKTKVRGSWLKKATVALLLIYNALCLGYATLQSATPVRVVVYRPAVRIYPVVVTATPTATPVRTPVPTTSATPTTTVIPIPDAAFDVPEWVTKQYFRYLAGIVRSETYPLTDTLTLNFVATQVWFDANSAKKSEWGNLNKRWKAGDPKYWKEPTHEAYQAMSFAIINRESPLTQRCAYVGGIRDSSYFAAITGTQITHIYGHGPIGVIGYNCASTIRP